MPGPGISEADVEAMKALVEEFLPQSCTAVFYSTTTNDLGERVAPGSYIPGPTIPCRLGRPNPSSPFYAGRPVPENEFRLTLPFGDYANYQGFVVNDPDDGAVLFEMVGVPETTYAGYRTSTIITVRRKDLNQQPYQEPD